MELNFDLRGLLKPYDIVEATLKDFENNFVFGFDESQTRYDLFWEFQKYNQDLQNLLQIPYFQWINGSFVTNKEHPNDIDIVTFIDFSQYHKQKQALENQFSKFGSRQYYKGLDAYLVCVFPENHEFYQTYRSDYAYWYNLFGNPKYNRAQKRYSKGFIQINY